MATTKIRSISFTKTASKIILPLIFLAQVNPVVAAKSNTDKLTSNLNNALIAGFGAVKVDPALRRRQEVERSQQQYQRELQLREQERQIEYQRQQRDLDAQKEAQLRYFNNLSPAEQQAYISELRARQARQEKAAGALLFLFLGAGFSDGGSSNTQSDPRYIPDRNTAPSYNSAPAPAPTVHPNYDGCHHYSC